MHEVVWQCSRAVVILNVVDVAIPDGAAGVIFHERQGLANIKSSRSILQENFSKNKNKGIPAYLRLDYRTRGQSGKIQGILIELERSASHWIYIERDKQRGSVFLRNTFPGD